MDFYGIQKTSLVDYPGQIACTLFTYGCNFRCPYCHNAELVSGSKKDLTKIVDGEVLEFLRRKRKVLDAVVITGGEPLIHTKGLIGFLRSARRLGYLIKIDTNGSYPSMIEQLNKESLVDFWAMDVKFGEEKYSLVTQHPGDFGKVKKSIAIIMNSPAEYEFRTTVVPGLHDASEIRKIGELIKGGKRHAIQNFMPNGTLDPKYEEVKSFVAEKLKRFAKVAEGYVEFVEVRD